MNRFINIETNPGSFPSALGNFVVKFLFVFVGLSLISNGIVILISFAVWEWLGLISSGFVYRIFASFSIAIAVWFASDVYRGKV